MNSDFHEVWHGCSASAPNVTVNFRDVKVKVQGQIRRTENLPLAIARLWFKISSAKFGSPIEVGLHSARNKYYCLGTKCKMSAWWRSALSGCFF